MPLTGLIDKLPSDSGVPAIFGFIIPLTKHTRPNRKHEKFVSDTPAVFAVNENGEYVVKSPKSLYSLVSQTFSAK